MTGGERALAAGQPSTQELPGLTVAAGQPTSTELAALTAAITAVLATRAAAGRSAAASRRPAGGWADRANLLRAQLVRGPDAWRRSARHR